MEKFNFNIKSVIDCLVPSEVTMITGGPGAGKTMLALNIAAQYGVNEDKTVAIFSLEQSAKEVVIRLVCMLANISSLGLQNEVLDQKILDRVYYAQEELANSKIYIDDTVCITLQDIERKIKVFIRNHGCVDLIIIDYLQLISEIETRDIAGAVSAVNKLKVIAKKFNVPIILLSQMVRDGKGSWKNTYPSSIADTCISMVRERTSDGYYQEKEFYMTFDYGKHKGDKILLDCDFRRDRISEKI